MDSIKKQQENELDEIRAKIRNFLDRLSKASSDNLTATYEKEIEKLTNEEQILEKHSQVMRGRSADFGTALDMTFNFLKNPYQYWMNGDLKAKHLVMKLVFTDKLTYERGVGFRTANLSLPLRVFELSTLDESSMVDPTGLEPATPSVQMRCSTR